MERTIQVEKTEYAVVYSALKDLVRAEDKLNSMAQEGWRVVTSTSNSICIIHTLERKTIIHEEFKLGHTRFESDTRFG